MRKMAVLLVFLGVFAPFVIGCSTTQNATVEDFGNMDNAIVPTGNKSVTYKKSMRWVAETYQNPSAVLEYYDETSGIITLNGAFEYREDYAKYYLHYKLTMLIEKGEIQFKMQPLYWIGQKSYGVRKVFTQDMARFMNNQYMSLKTNYMAYVL